MESHINDRFIEVVDYLLENNIESKKSSISEKLKIKPSNFSEILKRRVNISLETASIFCDIYNVNAEWFLFGKGEMFVFNFDDAKSVKKPFKQDLNTNDVQLLNELIESYKTQINDKKEIIFLQNQFIESIRNELINIKSFKHFESLDEFRVRMHQENVEKEQKRT
jgi:hypothetical protein